VNALLDICLLQQEQIQILKEQIQILKDEIARLKGLKPKPKIKPSALEDRSARNKRKRERKKRGGSSKRHKTRKLEIHETVVVCPDNLPEGSRFRGYKDFTVQDLVIRPHNTLYRLMRWETPSGDQIVGKLPVELYGGHFGPMLNSFMLYQYYHAHVTQPLILEQQLEFGIDISSGQVNWIITKSRINFLEILRAGHTDYVLNDEALEYMQGQKLHKGQFEKLATHNQKVLRNKEEWEATLVALEIAGKRHVRIATEGALLGSILKHEWNPNLAIISDDAGQFNVLLHGLCWIHAERTINKLVGFSDTHRQALDLVRSQIWDFYDELKAYKDNPDGEKKVELEARFDDLFTQKTCFVSLNLALGRIHKNKSELLLVLDRPDIALHNNLSEQDIREYVKKRKISGSTRSDEGRRCRDTFTSLKKTCRKQGISFWKYINDRVFDRNQIPPLAELIRQQARASPV
jgi:hypothetical protein